jgi:hypothetical protein
MVRGMAYDGYNVRGVVLAQQSMGLLRRDMRPYRRTVKDGMNSVALNLSVEIA